jgi:DNA (cytosine-5)-methyltransferase 1
MKLRFGSLSSGIGGDAVAWEPLGWKPVFTSEIAAFPSAVLAHHYPNVPNLGDFTAEDFCDRARAAGKIDVFGGGTPCQAFSVAGKRGSLDDNRGNLTLRFVEIVHELDTAIVVWENVPGVLSTEDNAFGCFIGGMVGAETALIPCDDCGSHYAKRYWRTRTMCDEEGNPTESWRYPVWPDYGMVTGPKRSLAWRILDAQHFGLAQRRRRVIVISFRARDGINPGAVLFEPESVRRDSPPSREEGAGVAPTIAARTKGGGGLGTDFECDGGLVPSVAPTIRAGGNATGGDRPPGTDVDTAESLIPTIAHAFDWQSGGDARGLQLQDVPQLQKEQVPAVAYQCHGGNVGPMGTLRAGNGNEGGGVPFVAIAENGRGEIREMDVVPALGGGGGKPGEGYPAVAFVERGRKGGRSCESQEDIAYTLLNPGEGGRTSEGCVVDPVMRVRRLMPIECERLQGFSDGWTRIAWKTKSDAECPDGHRYKGLGNAWATFVFRWIGRRIEMVLEASGVEV